jgi:hypothetical protein
MRAAIIARRSQSGEKAQEIIISLSSLLQARQLFYAQQIGVHQDAEKRSKFVISTRISPKGPASASFKVSQGPVCGV